MATGVEAPPPLVVTEFVSISRQEHIALKSAAYYWRTLHRKAVDHFQWRELQARIVLFDQTNEPTLQCAKSVDGVGTLGGIH